MNKTVKRLASFVVALCLVMASCPPRVEAAPYSGKYSVSGSWSERNGFLWLNKDTYTFTGSYASSFIVLLNNLSGTKYWGNYKNQQKTAQSMTIGVHKETTVSKSSSWTISASVGFEIPVKAAKICGELGGSYTNSKTYAKTEGTSSAYVIDTNSKNGYYAVTHAANCDSYNITLKKNGSNYSSGKLIRFAGTNGYERLWYSSTYFE
jgi:hypothetical protein